MKKDIIKKIELLVEMSGTTNSYETLSEDLSVLNQEIDNQKVTVRDLKKSMTDNKYIRANERIVDETIKVGVENRLNAYNNDLKELEGNISDASLEEEGIHKLVVSMEHELTQLNSFLESLELKMKTIGEKDQSVYSFYEGLISKTNEEISVLNKKLEDKNIEYSKITKKMEQLGNTRSDLEEKILTEEINLRKVLETLANPNSYIDYKAKVIDEKNVDKYINDLEALEHRRLEILTDPAFIGYEAKKLYMDGDKSSSLDKIKELITIIQTKPYMSVANNEIDELLEEATTKRDEFVSLIENKSYAGADLSVAEKRIAYLNNKKKKYETEITELKAKIQNIDLNEVKELVQTINDIKVIRDQLSKDVEVYRKVILENKEQKTPKKQASLKSAMKKKTDELKNIESILDLFENDLETLVISSKTLEEKDLQDLYNSIQELDEEIENLKKQDMMNTVSKDILSVEKDKDELKKLNEEVQNILNRKKYSKNVNEIYDEIEMYFGTDDLPEVEAPKQEEFVNLDEYKIDSVEEEPVIVEEEVIPVIEEKEIELPPVEKITVEEVVPVQEEVIVPVQEEVIIEEPSVEEKPYTIENEIQDIFSDIDFNFSDKEVKEYPPRSTTEDNKNRFKVIKVEPLDVQPKEEKKPALEPDDVVITDLEDTDFISFNDLLEGDSQ